MNYAIKLKTVKSKYHLLELEKHSFYKLYFDVEDYSREFLQRGKVVLILDNKEIIAFRENDRYFEVDRYSAVL